MARKFNLDEKWYYIMIKGSIYKEDILMLNVHPPNKRVSKYVEAKMNRTERRL